MKDIFDATLILFDFDGVLVNTEQNHYLAYKTMVESRGFNFQWDFTRYCQAAHYISTGLRDQIYEEYPALEQQEPNWEVLYEEKKANYSNLIEEGGVALMPGVESYLRYLDDNNIKRCVVTHSPLKHISMIRKQLPLLDTIPNWITREDYDKPKPSAECYLKAIDKLGVYGDRIIGYEDTPRGLQALLKTSAQSVLVCTANYPEIIEYVKRGVWHYPSFETILDNDKNRD